MDKKKLKKHIKGFAMDVGLATAAFALSLIYIPMVIDGDGLIWVAIGEVLLIVFDTFEAVSEWKKIKAMLEDDVNVQE